MARALGSYFRNFSFVRRENSHEGDPAVTGRVMDLHENEIFHLVRYLEHLELSGSCLESFFFKKFLGA